MSGLSYWTTSLFCLHGFTRFFISLLCWWHSTLPLVPSWWSDDNCSHLSMSSRHFLLDEGPSPLTQNCLWFQQTHHFHHNFTFQLGSSTITPSKTSRNLGVVIDKLTVSDHIAKTARSCRFALYNIKKIRPFLSEHATQLLVQALVLSRLDYCNSLLAGLPANSFKPLQLIQSSHCKINI